VEEIYDKYELLYGELEDEPPVTGKRRPAKAYKNLMVRELEDIVEKDALKTTYTPSRFEKEWLLAALGGYYQDNFVTDVLAKVKGGKEANVYCCLAHEVIGVELLAAKVYRPRQQRNLRNDKMYREGRPTLKSDGTAVKGSDHRLIRAMNKKSDFGKEVQHTSWLMYEYTTLATLHEAGAAVPKPYAVNENSILMGYRGSQTAGAPTLHEIDLSEEESLPLFQEVMRNIALMLEREMIHGDLSAYNILYWEGEITLIDFPQVTHSRNNENAYMILERDITRVCEYFASQGITNDPQAILEGLWYHHEANDWFRCEWLPQRDGSLPL
jgi:RIO kinase 1